MGDRRALLTAYRSVIEGVRIAGLRRLVVGGGCSPPPHHRRVLKAAGSRDLDDEELDTLDAMPAMSGVCAWYPD